MTASKHDPYRLYLTEDQIPKAWYNLRADMPEKPEPMRLPNGAVATKPDIAPVFADALIDQELDDDTPYFNIPEPVLEMYKVYRPSPLCRAYNLERALDTPAKIFYNSKATTRAVLTSSTPPSPKLTTPMPRALPISRPRRAPGSGARHWLRQPLTMGSTSISSW